MRHICLTQAATARHRRPQSHLYYPLPRAIYQLLKRDKLSKQNRQQSAKEITNMCTRSYVFRLPQAATPCPCRLPHTLPHLSIHTRSLLAELRVILSISLADPSGKSKIPRKMLHMPGEKKNMGKRERRGNMCVRLWQGEVASCCLTCCLAAAFKCTLNIT